MRSWPRECWLTKAWAGNPRANIHFSKTLLFWSSCQRIWQKGKYLWRKFPRRRRKCSISNWMIFCLRAPYLQVLWRAVCQGPGQGAGWGGQHVQHPVQHRRQAPAGEREGRGDWAADDEQRNLPELAGGGLRPSGLCGEVPGPPASSTQEEEGEEQTLTGRIFKDIFLNEIKIFGPDVAVDDDWSQLWGLPCTSHLLSSLKCILNPFYKLAIFTFLTGKLQVVTERSVRYFLANKV